MQNRIKTVALLTDFGIRDHYAGVVKGRILKELSMQFFVNFIDITHEIPPQDVKQACLLLYFSYKYFPEGTIFLAIVDPGVGTERKAIVLKSKDYIFVGPDNGIFSLVFEEERKKGEIYIFEINEKTLLKPPYSSTFHGRDLFAPAVALILQDKWKEEVFIKISSKSFCKLNFPQPEKTERGYRFSVWYVDTFGNLITNFHKGLAEREFKVMVNRKEVPFVKSYGYGKKGEVISLFGSEGLLEVSVNQGSAYEILGIPEIEIEWK